MDKGLLFWIIFVVALLFYGFGPFVGGPYYERMGSWPLIILIFLLGWATFGFVVK